MKVGVFAVALIFGTRALFAQSVTAPLDEGIKPELRADVIDTRNGTALDLGAGIQIPAGYYARIGVIGGIGANLARPGNAPTTRLDVVGRFLLDPFRQSRWGISAGAGVSLRSQRASGLRPYLLAIIDLEGPRSASGVSPAFQVGIGGGIRIGGAIRWGAAKAR